MNPEYISLKLEHADNITEVILTGPGKGNLMGPDFWRELPEVFSRLDGERDVRAIIIRGEGTQFSTGLDVMAAMNDLGPLIMGENLAAERTRLLELIGQWQHGMNKVANCRKPVIAAIHGWCIGGGLDLISACDIRLCSAEARFSLREVKLAIVADVGSLQRLPHIIGQGHTRELAFTGKNIDAARALRIGLVNEIYDTPEAMLTAARAMAREIADNPPLVVQGIKQVMNYGVGKSISDALDFVAVWNSAFLQSTDLAEALAAYSERRKPTFRGE